MNKLSIVRTETDADGVFHIILIFNGLSKSDIRFFDKEIRKRGTDSMKKVVEICQRDQRDFLKLLISEEMVDLHKNKPVLIEIRYDKGKSITLGRN